MTVPEILPIPTQRQRQHLHLKRGLPWAGAAFLVGLLWLWPARRNYYSKRGEVARRLDVSYVATDSDPKRRLDLYLPRGDATGFPIVVFVHGGYWSPLDRRWLQPLIGTFGNVGVAFASHGVAAAVLGYRQYPQIRTGDESLDDIATGIRFVRDSCRSWGCDQNRIFVIGHSAGGHLVSLLALDERILAHSGVDPKAIAGFVSIDGIFDLGASLGAFAPEQVSVMRELFGPEDGALSAHSPITYARARHPALLFVDSTGDEKVCLDGFHAMKTRMAEVGSPARFVELPGLGHNEAIVGVGMKDDPLMPTLLGFVRSPSNPQPPPR
jgi:acetyl esterase/lipase